MSRSNGLDRARREVKDALSSVTTSSADVVRRARTLLIGPDKSTSDAFDVQPTAKHAKASRAVVAKPKNTTKTTKSTSMTRAHVEVYEDSGACLSLRERYEFATELVNVVLRTLAFAVRNSTHAQISRVNENGDISWTSSTHAAVGPSSSTPLTICLQTRSANQVPSPLPNTKIAVKSSTYNANAGIVAVAECGILAFECLRRKQPEVTGKHSENNLQLEEGMLAFIGKLITLKLMDLALKELKILKRRLVVWMDGVVVPQGSTTAASRSAAREARPETHETMASLIHFDHVDLQSPAIRCVIDLQILVLKVILASRRAAVIEHLPDYLDYSSESSVILLMTSLSTRSGMQDQMATQLESVAQIILLMCPKTAAIDDVSACDASKAPSPETCFKLQILAYETHLTWRHIARHCGDPYSEVLKPFQRCIGAYTRRSSSTEVEKYKISTSGFYSLWKRIEAHSIAEPQDRHMQNIAVLDIKLQLSRLAQDAHLWDDAKQWACTLCQAAKKLESSGAKKCAFISRVAALGLHLKPSPDNVTDLAEELNQAVTSLNGNMTGSVADLQLLLHEATGLRNAALFFWKSYLSRSSHRFLELPSDLVPLCQSVFRSCIRLLRRCLQVVDQMSETDQQPRKSEMRIVVHKAVKPTVECVIFCFHNQNCADATQLSFVSAAYRECLALLKQTPNIVDDSKISLYVRLSNACWILHSRFKVDLQAFELNLKSLRLSCECLDGRPRLEKETGSLAIKLAKLGRTLQSCGYHQESIESLIQSVQTELENGALQTSTTALESSTLQDIWAGKSRIGHLGQTITTLLEYAENDQSSLPNNLPFYDDISLDMQQRSLLLELQLTVLSQRIESNNQTTHFKRARLMICKQLLLIYNEETHPLRQRRVALNILHLAIDDTLSVDAVSVEQAEKCARQWPIQGFGKDACLCDYSEPLQASLKVALAFRHMGKDTEQLEEALSIWNKWIVLQGSSPDTGRLLDDLDLWLTPMRSISDYFEIRGFYYLQLSTTRLILKIGGLYSSMDRQALGLNHINLSKQLLRLGYSEEAGLYLVKAREWLAEPEVDTLYRTICHVAHVEYFLALGDLEKCEEHLVLAKDAGAFNIHVLDSNKSDRNSARLIAVIQTADYFHAQAQLAWETGQQNEALQYAMQQVTLLQRAWKNIEFRQSKIAPGKDREHEGTVEAVATTLSKLALVSESSDDMVTIEALDPNGSTFWPLAPRLYRALSQISAMFYNFGMFQNAMHYLEQVYRLAKSIGAGATLANVIARKGDYMSRSGAFDDSKCLLEEAAQQYHGLEKSYERILYHCSFGYLYRLQARWKVENDHYLQAEQMLEALISPTFARSLRILSTFPSSSPAQESSQKLISSRGCKQQKSQKSKTKNTNKARAASRPAVQESLIVNKPRRCLQSETMRDTILRLRAESLLSQGDATASMKLLSKLDAPLGRFEVRAQQRGVMARALIKASLSEMASDSILSILPESTLSFPATANLRRRASSNAVLTQLSSPAKPNHTKSPRKRPKMNQGAPHTVASFLSLAMDHTSEIRSNAMSIGSVTTILQSSSAFATAAILTSVVQPEVVNKFLHPMLVAYSLDLPRSVAGARERGAVTADAAKHSNIDAATWPNRPRAGDSTDILTISSLQSDLIDLFPESWAAVSISLDEAQDHLYITRYEAHQLPFNLRLPLTRQHSDDVDDETFSFLEAKTEMRQIIELSDSTVHAARENAELMRLQGAKTKWWAEREALDNRLRDLLENMENLWLGGFRGIFSHAQRTPELLARFQYSFENILDKHLPSRQKTQKRNSGAKVHLSPRIFDLFVGLDEPSNNDAHLDEALTDLLYYVIDILQFNGECNAYDEIDFDSIVVEIQDALQSYHEAVRLEYNHPQSQHTILILDKQLHMFPWESIPCLNGRSVSRLSSLLDLRERILVLQQQNSEDPQQVNPSNPPKTAHGIYLASTHGTYILNPSGDLSATQSRLHPALSTLNSTWTPIITRAPTPSEFITALTPHPDTRHSNILLYFGHGSGAQYVRTSHIKRLRIPKPTTPTTPTTATTATAATCNTALLFGCSSAALREVGEFEPYGTPAAYLVGGAPAVLGSLWDVTDGDVDVFAGKVLEGWGLLEKGSCKSGEGKGRGKEKGKGRVRGRGDGGRGGKHGVEGRKGKEEGVVGDGGERERERLCLSEAVARGRGECYLRYLNGAAMVVYGVPVFLAGSP